MTSPILIVVVTKTEIQAVLEEAQRLTGKPWDRRYIDGKTYYGLGEIGGVEILAVQSEMGSIGPGASLLTAKNAVKALEPRAIIMVGIAFGMQPSKQKLGEILVSRQIQCYESQKLREDQIIPRGDRVSASVYLLDKFRSGDVDWNGDRVHFGLIMSGEKLVASSEFRQSLLKLEPEAIGGEMEGAGLYAGASESKVDWIVVKGICDFGDENKTDDAQLLAANNAARFVMHVLKQGGLADRNRRQILVVIDGDFGNFDASRRRDVIATLSAILRTDKDEIRILKAGQGSIKLTIDLPTTAADRLYKLATSRRASNVSALIRLGITEIEIEPWGTVRIGKSLKMSRSGIQPMTRDDRSEDNASEPSTTTASPIWTQRPPTPKRPPEPSRRGRTWPSVPLAEGIVVHSSFAVAQERPLFRRQRQVRVLYVRIQEEESDRSVTAVISGEIAIAVGIGDKVAVWGKLQAGTIKVQRLFNYTTGAMGRPRRKGR